MTKELFLQAILKFFAGVILLGVLLFLPAGTLRYWNAWLLMGILFVPMFLAGIVMMCRNPDLLKKRLDAKEKENEQRLVIMLSGLMFVLGFVTAGLNFRFQWIVLPKWVSRAALPFSCFLICFMLRSCGKTHIFPVP